MNYTLHITAEQKTRIEMALDREQLRLYDALAECILAKDPDPSHQKFWADRILEVAGINLIIQNTLSDEVTA